MIGGEHRILSCPGLWAERRAGRELPLVAREQVTERSREVELWLGYRRTGKAELRNELVLFHAPWAARIVRAFARTRGIDWQDVWGTAQLALIEAVERFDPADGVPFRGYAIWRIRGSLQDAARSHAVFRTRHRPYYDQPDGEEDAPREGPLPDAGSRARPGRRRRIAGPAEAAEASETRSILLDSMPDDRAREVASRRIFAGESVDEIGYAMKLGKTRVQEILANEVLPRARRTLLRLGIRPRPVRDPDEGHDSSELPGEPPGDAARASEIADSFADGPQPEGVGGADEADAESTDDGATGAAWPDPRCEGGEEHRDADL